MTRAPHYAIAAIVIAAISLALAPLALTRSQRAVSADMTPAAVTVTPTAGSYVVTPNSVALASGQRLIFTNRDAASHSLMQISGPHVQVRQGGHTASVEFSKAGVYTFSVGPGSRAGGKPLTVIVSR